MKGAIMGFHQADRSGRDNPAHEVRDHSATSGALGRSRYISVDPSSKKLDSQLDTLAARHTTVLVVGESGVGKERVAREIHDRSARAAGPFVAVDCSSFSEALIESQLFGHMRGAFTGAEDDKIGYIRAADGGTLFLDEVGDMPLSLQTRLLRVLQERNVTPVGQTEPVPVDVRIIAATHCNLPYLVRTGRFREDLFYRLSAFRMVVPPLRERPNDVVPLARYFLDLQAEIYEEPRKQLSPEVCRWLLAQCWRGNVRELANAIEYALVSCEGDALSPADFPEPVLAEQDFPDTVVTDSPSDPRAPRTPKRVLTMREAEWQAVMHALHAAAGDKTHAAHALAISRSRLYSILARQDRPENQRSSRSAS